jgi:hypothetical protein
MVGIMLSATQKVSRIWRQAGSRQRIVRRSGIFDKVDCYKSAPG